MVRSTNKGDEVTLVKEKRDSCSYRRRNGFGYQLRDRNGMNSKVVVHRSCLRGKNSPGVGPKGMTVDMDQGWRD